MIEREVRCGVREGYEQVVVIGGGFDTLAIRLKEETPPLHVFEIDHPSTQAAKISRLPPSKVQFVSADLRDTSVSEALEGSGFDRYLPTIYVLEGLLMYLKKDAVHALLSTLPGASRRIVFTAMDVDAMGHPCFKNQSSGLDKWLERRGEPFLWGCAPIEMSAFLETCGLRLLKILETAALELNVNIADGEVIYIAEGMGA